MEKKIFRQLAAILLVAFVGCVLVSCGDDEEETTPQNSLIGTWTAVPDEDGDVSEMVFSADGSFTNNIYIDGRIEDIFLGRYSVAADKVTIRFSVHKERNSDNVWSDLPYEEEVELQFSVKGKQLQLKRTDTGETESYTLKE